jgi:hypothetical protein
MSQADTINTTSRRGFLARGAATVAGASLLATPAFPLPAGADPIFDAIEKHKVARAAVSAAVHQHDHHEDAHTSDAVELAFDAETDAACTILSIKATTAAGLVALLRYAIEADTDGMGWPDQLQSDDGKLVRSWHYFLVENLAETVSDMNVGMI